MTWGKSAAVVTACGFLVAAAVLTLRWTAGRLDDISFTPGTPAEAGEPLDPEAVSWLDRAPERTRVDPDLLKSSIDRLRTHLDELFPLVSLDGPWAETTNVQVPLGWNDSTPVSVLIGASQAGTIEGSVDRCAFLVDAAASLVDAGWKLRSERRDAIQTDYPLVFPGPVDLSLSGYSVLGRLTLSVPAGGGYALSFWVDEPTLNDAPGTTSGAVSPPAIRCG